MEPKSLNSKNAKELRAGRIIVYLNREEFDFVDTIGKDALFTTGKRMTNNKIVRAFVSALKGFKIDARGISNYEELKERIISALSADKERVMAQPLEASRHCERPKGAKQSKEKDCFVALHKKCTPAFPIRRGGAPRNDKLLPVAEPLQERRLYPRLKKEVKVSYRGLESLDDYQAKETKNISQGGFRIELTEERKAGEPLEFTITDPELPDNPLKAYGCIAWVKGREAGVKLTYLPEMDKERFNKLVGEKIEVSKSNTEVVK